MTRILLLGGTGEALRLARLLGPDDVYSLAGLGGRPDDLPCAVRVAGFGGKEGLMAFIRTNGIGLVVDATHPYAETITANARYATETLDVLCWRLHRQSWAAAPGDRWTTCDDWAAIVQHLAPYQRILFTLGRGPLARLNEIPETQHWFIRCLGGSPIPAAQRDRATLIAARGPFFEEGERALFDELKVDIIVSKNSGGAATQAKLSVARERGLPVLMLQRKHPEDGDRRPLDGNPLLREFSSEAALAEALSTFKTKEKHQE